MSPEMSRGKPPGEESAIQSASTLQTPLMNFCQNKKKVRGLLREVLNEGQGGETWVQGGVVGGNTWSWWEIECRQERPRPDNLIPKM